jgi:hypothetical protein
VVLEILGFDKVQPAGSAGLVNLLKRRLCGLYDFGRGFSRTECVDNDATNADQPPVFVLHPDHGSIRGNPISYESTTQAGIAATRLAENGFGCSACGDLSVVRVRQVLVTGLRKLNSRETGLLRWFAA